MLEAGGPALEEPAPDRSVIQVCGRLVAWLDGRRIDPSLPGHQGRLLFVYLVVNRTRETGPGELIEALWPESPPAGVEGTLRSLVSKIRRAVGSEALGRGGGYRLDLPRDVRVDMESAFDAVHRAETAVQGGDWRRAWGPAQVALFIARRGFLPQEEAPWATERRLALAEVELRSLECYARATLGVGGVELPSAERTARRLVAREPFRESGYRILMQALAEQGNIADALFTYTSLQERLREELGVEPSAQTQALYTALLRAN